MADDRGIEYKIAGYKTNIAGKEWLDGLLPGVMASENKRVAFDIIRKSNRSGVPSNLYLRLPIEYDFSKIRELSTGTSMISGRWSAQSGMWRRCWARKSLGPSSSACAEKRLKSKELRDKALLGPRKTKIVDGNGDTLLLFSKDRIYRMHLLKNSA